MNQPPANSDTTEPKKPRRKRFTPAQIDFILRKIAAFYTIREITECFSDEFPESGQNGTRIYNKVRYLSRNQKTCKWARKIEQYRREFRTEPLRNYPLANRFERIKILQRLVDEACSIRLRRVIWYPIFRNPNGSVTYHRVEIAEPNYQAAYRGIQMVIRELKAAGLYESNNLPHAQTELETSDEHDPRHEGEGDSLGEPVDGVLVDGSTGESEEPKDNFSEDEEKHVTTTGVLDHVPANGTTPHATALEDISLSSRRGHADASCNGCSNHFLPCKSEEVLNKCELTPSIMCDNLSRSGKENLP